MTPLSATGTMNLLPLLTVLLEQYPDIPILAAGGIATGRALAAVLAAGAEGVWMGTALMATPECVEVPDAYKERLVASRGEDTIFTEVFNIHDPAIFDIPAWPHGIAAHALTNRFVQEWQGREAELWRNLDSVLHAYLETLNRRDPDVCGVYIGQSADGVKAVEPAGGIVRRVCEDAERILMTRLGHLAAG